ncbi:MAG: chemotaxis protein CheA [Psychrobium sp.]|nr:chemotaxis protein CheA [Psychrobium sp.]
MGIDLSQFIPTFLEESFEGLEIMESSLLGLEQGDIDSINAIFRAAHSIKGGAGTFGFNRVTDFTHEVETLLDEMRDGRRPVTQADNDLLLKSTDCIRLLINSARDGIDCPDPIIDEVQLALKVALGEEVKQSSPAADEQQSDDGDNSGWLIEFAPHADMLQSGNDPIYIIEALAELGKIEVHCNASKIPSLSDLNPEECHVSWSISLHAACDIDVVSEIFEWVDDACELTISPLGDLLFDEPSEQVSLNNNVDRAAPVNDTAPSTNTTETTSVQNKADDVKTGDKTAPEKNKTAVASSEGGSIRVGIDKVDALINRVGELVITQAMLKQIGSELSDIEHESVEKLQEGLVQLEGNTRDLQEDVMRIRMLPISFVFNRFPRMVYDVSNKLGKKVVLKLTGEQTELDKTVMEKIGDPLVHLVRNSLDHGLEMPEERIAAGKDETGTVTLNAYHQGGYIVIDISDDGRGLNTQRIRDKALEKGMINSDNTLSDQEINELIFAPGFSTADEVSDLSGRGVGMDVVRRNIESLGGHVTLSSTPGKGSLFSVMLPLTLAILDGQLINVAGETYIVPLVAIVESAVIEKTALKAIAGQQSLYLFREEYIPLYSVRELFSVPGERGEADEKMVIIAESSGNKYALVVDELLDQQQVVLKSLEANYKAVEGISGATILGNGGVALIVDIKGLISLKKRKSKHGAPPQLIKEKCA